jgi:tetratricopeptide (TPR) repeat protein
MTYCNLKISFRVLFLLLVILNYFELNAQTKEIFSQKDDSTKVKQLLDLGYQYEFVNIDSALIIYDLAENISRKINYTIGIGKSLNYQGILQFEKGNYSAAEQSYLESIKEFEKINYLRGIAANYNNLGNIYLYYNDLDRCINQYLNSVTIFENINDTVSIINAYNNIGSIFYNNNQYQKSLEYLEKARQLSLSTSDSSFITDTYLNMSNSYNKLRDTINGNKYLQEALKLVNPNKDLYISIMVYNSYSEFLKQNGKIGEAVEYAKMSLALAQKSQNPFNICSALIHLGE